ncbi:MAG: cell division protein ZapA [Bacillota bacterium]|nr:cell division protein ZapA [Bacillota bacterium]
MEKNNMTVIICGREYNISGSDSREHITRVAELVDSKMRGIQKNHVGIGPSLLALMTAINLADEYLKLTDATKKEKTEGAGEPPKQAEKHKAHAADTNISEALAKSDKPAQTFLPYGEEGGQMKGTVLPETPEPVFGELEEPAETIWKPKDDELAKAVAELIAENGDDQPPKPKLYGEPWKKYGEAQPKTPQPVQAAPPKDEEGSGQLAAEETTQPDEARMDEEKKEKQQEFVDTQTIFDGF